MEFPSAAPGWKGVAVSASYFLRGVRVGPRFQLLMLTWERPYAREAISTPASPSVSEESEIGATGEPSPFRLTSYDDLAKTLSARDEYASSVATTSSGEYASGANGGPSHQTRTDEAPQIGQIEQATHTVIAPVEGDSPKSISLSVSEIETSIAQITKLESLAGNRSVGEMAYLPYAPELALNRPKTLPISRRMVTREAKTIQLNQNEPNDSQETGRGG